VTHKLLDILLLRIFSICLNFPRSKHLVPKFFDGQLTLTCLRIPQLKHHSTFDVLSLFSLLPLLLFLSWSRSAISFIHRRFITLFVRSIRTRMLISQCYHSNNSILKCYVPDHIAYRQGYLWHSPTFHQQQLLIIIFSWTYSRNVLSFFQLKLSANHFLF